MGPMPDILDGCSSLSSKVLILEQVQTDMQSSRGSVIRTNTSSIPANNDAPVQPIHAFQEPHERCRDNLSKRLAVASMNIPAILVNGVEVELSGGWPPLKSDFHILPAMDRPKVIYLQHQNRIHSSR